MVDLKNKDELERTVTVDDALDEKYQDKILFPDKVAKDKEAFKRLGLPKELR